MSKKWKLPVLYDTLDWRKGEKKEVREQYIKEQNNKCFYCNESLSIGAPSRIKDMPFDWSLFPKTFLDHPIHLQHDHNTGYTEGAVHNHCNAFLWQFEGR